MEGSPATEEGSSVSGLEILAAVDSAPTPDASVGGRKRARDYEQGTTGGASSRDVVIVEPEAVILDIVAAAAAADATAAEGARKGRNDHWGEIEKGVCAVTIEGKNKDVDISWVERSVDHVNSSTGDAIDYKTIYASSGRYKCKYCDLKHSAYRVGDTWQQVWKHGMSVAHVNAEKARKAMPAATSSIGATLSKMKQAEEASGGLDYEATIKDAQGVLALHLSRFMPKTNVATVVEDLRVLGVVENLMKLKGTVVASGGTTAAAMKRGTAQHKAAIATLLKAKSFVLQTDVAFLDGPEGRRGVLGIIAGCSAIGKPILLGVSSDFSLDIEEDFDDGEEPSSNNSSSSSSSAASKAVPEYMKIAAFVKKLFAEYGLDFNSQVSCLVGDGHVFNDALANELKVPRLYCIPHAMALVFKGITKHFQLFTTSTLTLSSVLKAGGGSARDAVIRDMCGGSARPFYVVSTRWGQLFASGTKQLERPRNEDGDVCGPPLLETIRMALRDSAFVAGKSDDGKVIDKKKTPVKSALASLRSAFEVDITTAVRKYHLEIEHLIVQKLAKTCDEIITLASADPERINLQQIVTKMEEYEKRLRIYSEESGPRHIFEKIFGSDANGGCHHKDFTSAEQEAIVDLYAPKIRAAAADALAIYEKYKKGTKKVPGIVKSLEHRLMYDQNCDPRPLHTDLRDYKEFFGSLPEHDTELLESK